MGVQELRLDADSIKVCALPVNLIEVVWKDIAPLLQMPVDRSHGEMDMASLKRSLLSGETLALLITLDVKVIAAVVLEVRAFPTGLRALYISLVGGTKMTLWMDQAIEVCRAIAKDFNCTEIRGVSVRDGWMRKLESRGWKSISTVLTNEV